MTIDEWWMSLRFFKEEYLAAGRWRNDWIRRTRLGISASRWNNFGSKVSFHNVELYRFLQSRLDDNRTDELLSDVTFITPPVVGGLYAVSAAEDFDLPATIVHDIILSDLYLAVFQQNPSGIVFRDNGVLNHELGLVGCDP